MFTIHVRVWRVYMWEPLLNYKVQRANLNLSANLLHQAKTTQFSIVMYYSHLQLAGTGLVDVPFFFF